MEDEKTMGKRMGQVFPLVLSLALIAVGYMADAGRPSAIQMAGIVGGMDTGVLPPQQGTTAFVGVHVVPMDSERVLEDQTVVVSDGVIQAVGPRGEVNVPAGARVIEGEGRYLMPGLAEMHAHVPPGDRPQPGVLEDIMFLYLANGITTIRGMLGSDYQLGLREELISGEMMGPTLYAAAPSLNGNSAQTPEEAERKVRQYADQGYDLLKIHPGIQPEVWEALTATAHDAGISFGGHVPADVGLFRVLETGQTTVDHLDGFLEASVSEAVQARSEAGVQVPMEEVLASIDDASIRATVARAKESGVWVVPTSYLWENLYAPVNIDAALAQPEMKYVSQQQRNAWRNQKNNSGSQPAHIADRITEVRNQILLEANAQGVGILMGTDSPQLFNVPGFALHREIRVMEQAGMTPYEVLVSGTRNVATYVESVLEQDGNFGVVAPGNRADLVLLGSNPLESLDALQEREGTMVRGRWLSATDIESGLEALARKHASAS
jgi:imidazolonepropionase-like amidohydrolase